MWEGAAGQPGRDGRQVGTWHDPGTGALSKLNTGAGCLLLNHINSRDGFCDPTHRSKCSEQKLQDRPLQEGCFFLGCTCTRA